MNTYAVPFSTVRFGASDQKQTSPATNHNQGSDAPQAISYDDGLEVVPQNGRGLQYSGPDAFSRQSNPGDNLPEAVWRYHQQDSEMPQASHQNIDNLVELPTTATGAQEEESGQANAAKTQSWPRRHWKGLAVAGMLLISGGVAGAVVGTNKNKNQSSDEKMVTTVTVTDHFSPSKTEPAKTSTTTFSTLGRRKLL